MGCAYDFQISSVHITGVSNIFPDALSRIVLEEKFAAVLTEHDVFQGVRLPAGLHFRYPNQKTGQTVLEIMSRYTRTLYASHQKIAMESIPKLLRKALRYSSTGHS